MTQTHLMTHGMTHHTAHLLQHFLVRHHPLPAWVVPLKQEAALRAVPSRHVPVQAVVGDVGAAALEPLAEDGALRKRRRETEVALG